jgi:hypothetical protein
MQADPKAAPNIALQPTGCDRAVFALWKQNNAFPFYLCHFQMPPTAELFRSAGISAFMATTRIFLLPGIFLVIFT